MSNFTSFPLTLALSFALAAISGCDADAGDLDTATEDTSGGDSETSASDSEDPGEEEFRGGISNFIPFQVGANSTGLKWGNFWVDGNSDTVSVSLCYTQGFNKSTRVELFRDGFWSDTSYGYHSYNNSNSNCVLKTWYNVESETNSYIRIKKTTLDGTLVSGKFFVSTD